MSFLSDNYRHLIRQNRNSKLIKIGYKLANNFMIAYHNQSYYDMRHNGELYLIQSIKKYFSNNQLTVFDVGANRGHYASLVNDNFPEITIHCFELVPSTFDILKDNLSNYKNIFLNNFGLSNNDEIVQVTWFPQEDSGSSINPLPWPVHGNKVDCQVTSGDKYGQDHNISKIDLLKIDTEGHELYVIKGFSDFIKSERISVIQFEYGLTYIPPKATLGEIHKLLTPYNYLIGRLYPNGVNFKAYDLFADENFRSGNYVAVHRSATELIETLKI